MAAFGLTPRLGPAGAGREGGDTIDRARRERRGNDRPLLLDALAPSPLDPRDDIDPRHGTVACTGATSPRVADDGPPRMVTLGPAPGHQRGTTLGRLARCQRARGHAGAAAATLRTALAEVDTLDPTRDVQALQSALHADLGDALRAGGDLAGARAAHETALAINRELGDDRSVAVSQGQLGTIALLERDFAEAERRYRDALATFRALQEPLSQATAWHQIGMLFQDQQRWTEAEAAWRESARLTVGAGDTLAAATSWAQLAQVLEAQGKPADAEA